MKLIDEDDLIKIGKLMNKEDSMLNYYTDGPTITIRFTTKYKAQRFCSLLNQIGDAMYKQKKGVMNHD